MIYEKTHTGLCSKLFIRACWNLISCLEKSIYIDMIYKRMNHATWYLIWSSVNYCYKLTALSSKPKFVFMFPQFKEELHPKQKFSILRALSKNNHIVLKNNISIMKQIAWQTKIWQTLSLKTISCMLWLIT